MELSRCAQFGGSGEHVGVAEVRDVETSIPTVANREMTRHAVGSSELEIEMVWQANGYAIQGFVG